MRGGGKAGAGAATVGPVVAAATAAGCRDGGIGQPRALATAVAASVPDEGEEEATILGEDVGEEEAVFEPTDEREGVVFVVALATFADAVDGEARVGVVLSAPVLTVALTVPALPLPPPLLLLVRVGVCEEEDSDAGSRTGIPTEVAHGSAEVGNGGSGGGAGTAEA
jgi:hypothetical protein